MRFDPELKKLVAVTIPAVIFVTAISGDPVNPVALPVTLPVKLVAVTTPVTTRHVVAEFRGCRNP